MQNNPVALVGAIPTTANPLNFVESTFRPAPVLQRNCPPPEFGVFAGPSSTEFFRETNALDSVLSHEANVQPSPIAVQVGTIDCFITVVNGH